MIIFYADGERVRIHEHRDMVRAGGGQMPNTMINFGGKYGVGRAGKNKKGKDNQEGRRFFERCLKVRQGERL